MCHSLIPVSGDSRSGYRSPSSCRESGTPDLNSCQARLSHSTPEGLEQSRRNVHSSKKRYSSVWELKAVHKQTQQRMMTITDATNAFVL